MEAQSMIERVGAALERVQLFSRWNDWASDRVEGMPIEICRYGDPEKDEIIVVRRFDATWKEDDALRLCIREALAVAAIKAIRTPSKAMLDAGDGCCGEYGCGDYRMKQIFTAMIDTALNEQEKGW